MNITFIGHGNVGAALADRFPVLSREPGPRWLALNAALLVAILVMVAPKQPIAYGPSPDIYPAGAARFLTLHPPPGPVFCSYQFGSYLVFERVPAYFRDNLLNLGHLDIKADGRTEAKLPGDMCVPVGPLPLLHAGDVFRIRRPSPAPSTSEDKE